MNDQSSHQALDWVPTGIVALEETRVFLCKCKKILNAIVYVSIFAKLAIGTKLSHVGPHDMCMRVCLVCEQRKVF